MSSDEDLTVVKLQEHLREFWLILIHALLYSTGIYSKNAFQRVRILDSAVGYKCNHPDVCSWVETAASAISDGLESMKLSRVAFVVLNVTESGIRKLVSPGRLVVDTEFLPRAADALTTISQAEILEQLKGAISSVYAQLPVIFPSPRASTGPEMTMVILAERGKGEPLTLDSDKWMPQSARFDSILGPPNPDKVLPIRFVNCEEFTLSLYYES